MGDDRFVIPESLARTNRQERGAAGVEWLASLPHILAECEGRWALTIGPPFPQLSYNFAAPATRADGSTVVVKICYPDREFRTEAEALRLYDGAGAVRLYDLDFDQGIMLLEHIRPGSMLSDIEDDAEATAIAAGVMRQIWCPPPTTHSFPSVADWARGLQRLRSKFNGATGPFPINLVVEAERLYADLLGSQTEQVVLHGDLHHYNILSAERQPWLAIDPKGVVGEACYETGALIRNPVPRILSVPDIGRLLVRRIDQLADELGFDRKRIRDWAVAQAVLSAWWSYEDSEGSVGDEWAAFIEFTQVLADLP